MPFFFLHLLTKYVMNIIISTWYNFYNNLFLLIVGSCEGHLSGGLFPHLHGSSRHDHSACDHGTTGEAKLVAEQSSTQRSFSDAHVWGNAHYHDPHSLCSLWPEMVCRWNVFKKHLQLTNTAFTNVYLKTLLDFVFSILFFHIPQLNQYFSLVQNGAWSLQWTGEEVLWKCAWCGILQQGAVTFLPLFSGWACGSISSYSMAEFFQPVCVVWAWTIIFTCLINIWKLVKCKLLWCNFLYWVHIQFNFIAVLHNHLHTWLFCYHVTRILVHLDGSVSL